MADPNGTLVTIDGPAGSGKSTTARAVAERLGWRYLDSGALYRAITYALLVSGHDSASWPVLSGEDLDALPLTIELSEFGVVIRVDGRRVDSELRGREVTRHVSTVAALPAVRGWLLSTQRAAGEGGRLVADGRDMGTVVFPEAATKIFLEADSRERARRRLLERGASTPSERELEGEVALIEERDRDDSRREHSPLTMPPGATLVDTTDLDFEEQVDLVVRLARANAER